jgi:hypothetical protein
MLPCSASPHHTGNLSALIRHAAHVLIHARQHIGMEQLTWMTAIAARTGMSQA